MPVQPPQDHPVDLYLMLGKLDGKLDGIAGQLAAITSRADNHEQRITEIEHGLGDRQVLKSQFFDTVSRVGQLEQWKIGVEAEVRGASRVGNAIKGAAVALVALLAYIGYQIEVRPHSEPPRVEAKGQAPAK